MAAVAAATGKAGVVGTGSAGAAGAAGAGVRGRAGRKSSAGHHEPEPYFDSGHMPPSGAWRGEGWTDLQRSPFSWMQRLGLIPVQREDGPVPDGFGDGDPRLRALPSRSIASSSVDSRPAAFALQARRFRRLVFPEWAGPELAMPRVLASALLGGATAEGARDLPGLAISRRKKARWQSGLRRSSLRRRASEPRPDGVVLRVAGSAECKVQSAKRTRRRAIRAVSLVRRASGWKAAALRKHSWNEWPMRRSHGVCWRRGWGPDRGDGRVGAWRSWEWEEKERDESFLDRFPKLQVVEWSTRLATPPLVMLSRKSLTNNGTAQRSKQAVAGQAREVAGGRMLAGQWTRRRRGQG